ncbi:STY4534 family ICE replication protein [Halomonas elongata]|uniref:STY4534 family ICE replication protein n=1 Tax=Halomonas elongata TaxID=2746 RepID=UPI0023AF46B8|nr:STY4534 family ICE replication protein [Halomonas elongata]
MTTSTDKQFFDLHITGVGYLNRVREVSLKRGTPFWACDIAALNGPSDDVGYTRFDCRVSGREAERLVKKCEQAVNMKKKVLIGFRLGDLWTDTFTYSKGDRVGQTGVSLKARLLYISWIKVDGEMVYQAPRRDSDQAQPVESQDQQSEATQASGNAPEASPVPSSYAAVHSGEAAGSFDSPATH